MVQIEIKIPARFGSVLAQKPSVISLIERSLQRFAFADVLAPNVNITRMRAHCETRDQAPLNKSVRIMAHDFAIFAGAGLGFIGIDHQIAGPPI